MANSKTLARGLRNNNPGNIIRSNIKWQGKKPAHENTDVKFEQFVKLEFGVRALMVDVKTKISKGTDTITEIITKWAPPSDGNDTKAYIAFVSKFLGVEANTKLSASRGELIGLAKAIVRQETGAVLDDEVYDKAFRLM